MRTNTALLAGAFRLAASTRRGIDDGDRQIVEMARVASGERSTGGKCDAADHAVAKLIHLAQAAAFRWDDSRNSCRGLVEWGYPITDFFRRDAIQCRAQRIPAAARSQGLDAMMQFHMGDRGDPDRLPILVVQPVDDSRTWTFPHQFENHVGIQDQQSSKRHGLIG